MQCKQHNIKKLKDLKFKIYIKYIQSEAGVGREGLGRARERETFVGLKRVSSGSWRDRASGSGGGLGPTGKRNVMMRLSVGPIRGRPGSHFLCYLKRRVITAFIQSGFNTDK